MMLPTGDPLGTVVTMLAHTLNLKEVGLA
jgi:hypothetical protein